ncbi:phosphoribosylformimino-5-aminoimidazole carboxamide ribotide isomerase [uncultured Desulfobacter sp.]|uniref:phosphoribosylformimino-5-aminoimidazole carboxamide ribotide isomerase n=1 Tax=uncultured Desulfobacter sp. TaxID=240139 RepID=UPI002AA8E343|nr:phosphoribosylformimino-5-aminoimidazole carboxamide ribotide isomerase [uncultured Desulfobacter sp.]
MKFRPCIDLRNGKVVQIVGGTLSDETQDSLVTNFESARTPEQFARMYQADQLFGGHVIALGPGNTESALEALHAFPGGLQMGGGIHPENAHTFLDAGASHVIVTSYVFSKGRMDMDKLKTLVNAVGKNRLVLDLSCRKREGQFWIVTDRWQNFTEMAVTPTTLENLSVFCDEFLIHGVDVEGKMQGIQKELVELLGTHSPIPATYAGGASQFSDLDLVKALGNGRVDLTIGSALDIFGGTIPYQQVVAWHESQN